MQHEQSRDERYAQIASIDPARLAAFRAGLRRRYDDDEILEELRACAERLGRSPSMREFGNDPEATRAPADGRRALRLLERREAQGRPDAAPVRVARGAARRRSARLGEELGRMPSAKDLDQRRGTLPSKSLYWHTFGSLSAALREAGFDLPVGEERLAARDRAGRDALASQRPAAEVRRLGRGPQDRTRACSPSGRSTACSRRAAAPGRRSSSWCARRSASRASRSGPTGSSRTSASWAAWRSPPGAVRWCGRAPLWRISLGALRRRTVARSRGRRYVRHAHPGHRLDCSVVGACADGVAMDRQRLRACIPSQPLRESRQPALR